MLNRWNFLKTGFYEGIILVPKVPPSQASDQSTRPRDQHLRFVYNHRILLARRGVPTPRQGAPVSTPFLRSLPWREASGKGLGDTPNPPPKRAAPSLDSPAGREALAWLRLRCTGAPRGAPTPRQGAPVSTPFLRSLPWREAGGKGLGGYPQAPTKEGCALSGLSRRAGSLRVARTTMCSGSAGRPDSASGCARLHSVPPLAVPGGKQAVGAWGIPPSPHQRGLRPLWTLPPGEKPSRGSGCDVQQLCWFAAFGQRRT